MKNELISMVDRLLEINSHLKGNSDNRLEVLSFWKCIKYANFLNTPLNISMFVPAIKVGDKWEVLEKPKKPMAWGGGWQIEMHKYEIALEQYQTAKDNVIFEGFELNNQMIQSELVDVKYSAIQDGEYVVEELLTYGKPTLTKKGLEVSGLNK